jgi:hypothetical protein
VQQVLLAPHTALAGHVQLTEPQALLTVVPHAPLHVGSAQQVLLAASQACPAGQLPQTRLPQALLTVVLHAPLQLGSAQQVLVEVSHTLLAPQDLAEHVVVPQSLLRVTLHCPSHFGRSQQVPVTAPASSLQLCPEQPHLSVPPQPSGSVPHWPG